MLAVAVAPNGKTVAHGVKMCCGVHRSDGHKVKNKKKKKTEKLIYHRTVIKCIIRYLFIYF